MRRGQLANVLIFKNINCVVNYNREIIFFGQEHPPLVI